MSEDEEEVTETPTRRSRATKHTTTASSAITRSARRRPNIRQRGDTDDITRTPGAFPTEQSTTNMTPAKNSRPRAHSPRKKTKTAAEQEELVSSRRTTRARNLPAVEDESEALKKMPRNPSSHLIRNGDTPWPPRIQPHTRPRNNNNNSNNNSNQHRGRSGTSKKEMEMSTMTPKTTRRTRTKESVDITADNNNNNNGQTSSLYRTPSKKPASSMTEIATDNNSTPQRQVRMLTRSMRRANNAHGSGSDD
ncbi:hypothetical protein BDF19DRAFT_178406 [Syncephalis fuscata]|nr:hypothetical protein BDF19DRAFT_178406 [Syncephalis fuscata]